MCAVLQGPNKVQFAVNVDIRCLDKDQPGDREVSKLVDEHMEVVVLLKQEVHISPPVHFRGTSDGLEKERGDLLALFVKRELAKAKLSRRS